MDSKIIIQRSVLTALAVIALCAISCKKNQWADWKVQNEIWLENNKKQAGVQVSSSGLQYKIIADPTPQDARPNLNSTVICDYTATLINGYQVDYGNLVSLNLANVISGFAEGCHKIHNNGDIELYIPAYLGYDNTKYTSNQYGEAEGYGTEGTTGYIPPYSTLIYTIHICAVSE